MKTPLTNLIHAAPSLTGKLHVDQPPEITEPMNNRKIVITQRTADWHACIDGHPGMWGCGKYPAVAVGDLITAWPECFGITLSFPEFPALPGGPEPGA